MASSTRRGYVTKIISISEVDYMRLQLCARLSAPPVSASHLLRKFLLEGLSRGADEEAKLDIKERVVAFFCIRGQDTASPSVVAKVLNVAEVVVRKTVEELMATGRLQVEGERLVVV